MQFQVYICICLWLCHPNEMCNAISVRNVQCHKHTTMAEEEDRVRRLATLRKRKQARDVDRHHHTVEEYNKSERRRKSTEASRLGDKAQHGPR